MLASSQARRSAWPHAFDSAWAAATAMLVKEVCDFRIDLEWEQGYVQGGQLVSDG